MPELIAKMRTDRQCHPLRREFLTLRKGTIHNTGNVKVHRYYFEDHDDLAERVGILENYGFVDEIAPNRYRMSEQFAELLRMNHGDA